jgi:NADH dehydrogenase [ubiquinone] 1 alpha subcomplex assembly factor 6
VKNSTLGYCGQLVKAQDGDRFLLSMFAPPDRREALWALFAFNLEIAKTREVVSETQLGLIRLQWWREAIGKIYDSGEVLEHEVIKPLAAAINAYDLPRDQFETLIYAREFDLEDTLPGNIEGLLNYADFTSAPLLMLALKICDVNTDAEPVRPVAVNYALVGILRAVPFHARSRRCLLPEDLMKAHGQSVNKLFEMKPADGLPLIVRAVWEQRVTGIKTENRLLKAANGLAGQYFGQIKGARFDVFNPKLRQEPPFKALRLLCYSV